MKRTRIDWMFVLLVACAEQTKAPSTKAAPAKVEGAIAEVKLASVTLTEQAEQRIGLRTVRVQEQVVPRRRALAGTAVVPAGKTARIVAPFASRLVPAGASGHPLPGALVAAGQVLFQLTPLLPDSALQRLGAERDVEAAKAALAAAKVNQARATQLLADKTGSRRVVEDANAAVALASVDLLAATRRVEALSGADWTVAGTLPLVSPFAGTIQTVEPGPGQVVAAGAVLAEVAALDVLWIRVAVHAGDFASFEPTAKARILRLDEPPDAEGHEAAMIEAPPTADAATASIDLLYAIANADGRLRPGERVQASILLRDRQPRRIVPRAALLVSLHGSRWVYVRTEAHTFRRRAVEVAWIQGDDAILEHGLATGDEVVTLGAAELFGAEFGQGK